MRFVLEIVLFLFEFGHAGGFGKHPGKVGSDGWLLGNDERFTHYNNSRLGVGDSESAHRGGTLEKCKSALIRAFFRFSRTTLRERQRFGKLAFSCPHESVPPPPYHRHTAFLECVGLNLRQLPMAGSKGLHCAKVKFS
jgi:hypothetical protein